jgi:dTDP-4-amino-4,6-dideoxygalactose transaminase
MNFDKPLYVTEPSLPPLEEFYPYLQRIWSNKRVTNCADYHVEFERSLREYLDVPYVSLFANATIGLLVAIKALDLRGEVITTPYSFVATAHSIVWNGLTPVFVDIDEQTLNIKCAEISKKISRETSAILPVHVYGTPCDVDQIDEIAKKYNLRVIYDAAHAFGVKCHCGSVLHHGDLSVLSFHGTKVFQTFEGGAIISQTAEMKKKIDELKNFGFVSELEISGVGINGKLSEFGSALGLLQLKYIDQYISVRRRISQLYRRELSNIPGLRFLEITNSSMTNYSYFPIFIENNCPVSRDEIYEDLKHRNIFSRRYFYPLITDFPEYSDYKEISELPIATDVAQKVLCLPLSAQMSDEEVYRVTSAIADFVYRH